MASDILIKWDTRPVRAMGQRGLFHTWNLTAGEAIIELQDGTLISLRPESFKFLDSTSVFESFIWQDETVKENSDGR